MITGKKVGAGAHCVFLPGTVVGAFIAAGSVVRGATRAWEIWGGVPARKIRAIKDAS